MGEWVFEKVTASGYEEEGIAAFEVFNQQEGLDPIEVLVRESIQNSCDARTSDAEPVRVVFDLREFAGGDARSYLEQLDYHATLEQHLLGVASQEGTLQGRIKNEGLPQVDELELRVLTISDYNTKGLTGVEGVEPDEDDLQRGNFFKLVRSAMKTHEEGDASKGGSFGLGKAIYWMLSGVSSVVLYSVPSEGYRMNRSRLIGRSWLPSHKTTDANGIRRWNSFGGWFGQLEHNEDDLPLAVSYWDEPAEELAESLSIERDEGTGTSISIIAFDDPKADDEPSVGGICELLLTAVKKWYWPAIVSGKLHVEIRGNAPGEENFDVAVTDVSEEDELVGPFVRVWNAMNKAEPGGATADAGCELETFDWVVPTRRKPPEHDETPVKADIGVLISDISEEGGPGSTGDLENSIALMRGATGMVVSYHRNDRIAARYADSGQMYQGALLTGRMRDVTEADERLEEFLRSAEPPAHDRWDEKQGRVQQAYKHGSGPGVTIRQAINRIRTDIDGFLRREIEQEIPPGSKGPDSLMKLLRFGRAGTPEPEARLILRRGDAGMDDGSWKFHEASFGLSEGRHWPDADHVWSFKLWASIPEDGHAGSVVLPIQIEKVEGGTITLNSRGTEATIVSSPGIERVSFDLTADLPAGFSVGSRTSRVAVELDATEVGMGNEGENLAS